MKSFKEYLDSTGEVGFIEKVLQTVVYASGLPEARESEVILFETGEVGQVMSLTEDFVEILLLTNADIKVGTKVARTDEILKIRVGSDLLGRVVSPLGLRFERSLEKEDHDSQKTQSDSQNRPVEAIPLGIDKRRIIDKPFETGVSIVDLLVSLGKGQRELVVGDRKTGKSQFLLQAVLSQALRGTICVYAAIAKSSIDIAKIYEFLKVNGVDKNSVVVASSSTDPAGLVFLTPYTTMTIAEFFRDMGRDVLVILDDMTTHAKYYREISLLAKRFPGRSSYPGDIFYIHARLLERAGNFTIIEKDKNGKIITKEASITCLPVAELVMGDLSGYIQTNLMAMTDGHIFFDINLFNQGHRPAINPFLSVTRVGRQAQTPLLRDIGRELTSFLVRIEELKQFMHFGAELGIKTKNTLAVGEKIQEFFKQANDEIIPINVNVAILGGIWAGLWNQAGANEMKRQVRSIIKAYKDDANYKTKIDNLVVSAKTTSGLAASIKANKALFQDVGRGNKAQQLL